MQARWESENVALANKIFALQALEAEERERRASYPTRYQLLVRGDT